MTTKPILGYFDRKNPTPDFSNPPQVREMKEKVFTELELPTAKEIKQAMPAKPAKITKKPSPEMEAYYQALESVGRLLINVFDSDDRLNLTARRPFSGLDTTTWYKAAKTIKDELSKDGVLKKRQPDIGWGLQLASQQMWLDKKPTAIYAALSWQEKALLIQIPNDEKKRSLLEEYLSRATENRGLNILQALINKTRKTRGTKPAPEVTGQAEVHPEAYKVKPVIGKREIDTLIKQAELAEKELNKAKSEFDKAVDKVREAHRKLREELTITKRLMAIAE